MQVNADVVGSDAPESLIDQLLEHVKWPDLVLFLGVCLAVAIVLIAARRVIDKTDRTHQFGQQITMAVLTLVGVVAIILALPVEASLIQSLLGVIGLLLSGVVALSSTTFVGNALAGFMLRSLRNFKAGEFIRCEQHFGRVTEQGLIHTEIQTEDSDLTTLPNLFLVTHPMTTVRSKGTIISATVSLGYDVPRGEIDGCLLAAGEKVGLADPFVQILELGDFSVVYRLSGFTSEVNQLLVLRSRLRGAMMDELHGAGIEIVSPAFMNQRVLDREFIPEASPVKSQTPDVPTRSVFDKAEAAESYEFLVAERDALKGEVDELQKLLKSTDDAETQGRLATRKAAKEKRLARFDAIIDRHDKDRAGE